MCRQIDTHCDTQGTGGETQEEAEAETIIEHVVDEEDNEDDDVKVVMVTVVQMIAGWQTKIQSQTSNHNINFSPLCNQT